MSERRESQREREKRDGEEKVKREEKLCKRSVYIYIIYSSRGEERVD